MFAIQRVTPHPGSSSPTRKASNALRQRVHLTRGGRDRRLTDARLRQVVARVLAVRSRRLTDRRTRQHLAHRSRAILDSSPPLVGGDAITDSVADGAAREPVLGLAERPDRSDPVNPGEVESQGLLDASYAEHVSVECNAPRRRAAPKPDVEVAERNSCQRW
jgi:hypothetical protein